MLFLAVGLVYVTILAKLSHFINTDKGKEVYEIKKYRKNITVAVVVISERGVK